MYIKELTNVKPAHLYIRKKSSKIKLLKKNIPLMIMFLPVVIYYLIFKYAPMAGVIIAFKNYNFSEGIFGSPWVGLNNFKILFSNPQTLQIIKNTLILSLLSIFVGFPFPIALAILINEVRKSWFKRLVQTLVYLPHFLSWVIVGGIVVTVFSQQSGIVNLMLDKITGTKYPFLYKELSWIVIFVGSGIWKGAGWGAIIYLAALTNIDQNLYEAGKIDGATKLQEIRYITIPGISSTIVIMLILSMGHVMEVGFDPVFVLKNSSVSNIAEVISTYIFRVGIQGGKFSLTAAMGIFDSFVGFVLVVFSNRIARKYDQSLW